MKKILFILSLAAVGLVSCEMDHYRTDTMTSTQLKADPTAAVYTTDGNYSLFKDELQYSVNYSSGNTYVRHFFQMAEYRADNVVLSAKSSDNFSGAFQYNDLATFNNNSGFWWLAYRIIYGANSNIEAIDESASDLAAHMKGENYFMRAIAHFHLVNLYAKSIGCGEGNPGVVLRTSTDCSKTERATVGQVYAQVVEDLKEAARLMKGKTRRGDNGFIGYEAAMGLLSRVYLYMGMNAEVIATVNELVSGDPANKGDIASKLVNGDQYAEIFSDARNSKEVLWCVGFDPSEDYGTGSVGSMYYSPDGGGGTIGWGELYYSDPLLELFERYPNDIRHKEIHEQYDALDDGKAMVYWPVDEGEVNRLPVKPIKNVEKNADGKWAFKYSGVDYVVEQKDKDHNGYMENYIHGNPEAAEVDSDGDVKVHVAKNCGSLGVRNNLFPKYMNKKFSNQTGADGKPNSNLNSPVMLRWGEVVLNRAEAYAKLGNEADAVADLNVIRSRAEIAEWNNSDHKWRDHYAELVDVVLDERRLELCFEGHRAFDMWRNQLQMDRRFVGLQTWEVVDYNDNRIPFQIPQDEINASGIAQNPR